jgi:hypothetical protein
MKPKTFASLVQKYGRCVRSFDELGEAILLVTKELYKKYEALFAARGEVDAEDPVQTEEVEDELQERRGQDVSSAAGTLFQDRRSQKFMGAVKARDNQYLLNFIVTKQCRRIIWNEFFDNARKRRHFLFFLSHDAELIYLQGNSSCPHCQAHDVVIIARLVNSLLTPCGLQL